MIRTEFIRLVAQEILEVFYAPHKGFRKIVQNPKFLGPLLVLIVFVAVQMASAYVVSSRSFLEQTLPTSEQGDTWTESAVLWHASRGVTISDNHADYINSSNFYYNTTSIEFKADNLSSFQLFLDNFGGSVDCSADGFKNLSIRVKIVSPDVKPENATLYLLSLSPANFFAYDLTGAFSNSTMNVWNNITVPVDTADWRSSGSASWGNITGLRMDFAWPSVSSIDLRVDGLFFRGIFKGLLDINGSSVLITAALNSVTPFLLEWLLLTGLIYLLIKGLKGNVVWKPLMVAVGIALVTLVVQSIILLGVYAATLPNLNYPLEFLAYIPGEGGAAGQTIQTAIAQVLLAGSIVQVAVYVWIIALGAFIVRFVTGVAPPSPVGSTTPEGEGAPGFQQFGWLKCLLVSGVSFVLTITILGFLGIA
jgi:hypothetical protein